MVENRLHVIIDYSYLYYKYKFQLESGRMKRLTQPMEWHGVVVEKDVSQIYYSLREIEQIRRKYEAEWQSVTLSIAFDSKSARKESGTTESSKYKSNRGGKLNDDDFENIEFVRSVLSRVGYNTYKIEGAEADDIIAALVKWYSDSDLFGYTLIYTPDADVLENIKSNVAAMRYKSGKGYTFINSQNFQDVLSAELKCTMPYNCLMLYKCTVGDKSDCIDGIKGFGPAAFNKMIAALAEMKFDTAMGSNANAVAYALRSLHETGYFSDAQYQQAVESLELVKPIVLDKLDTPTKKPDIGLRQAVYMQYNMPSLVP